MNILILGGTTEASTLARLLANKPWRSTLSLAGRTRDPILQPIPCRIGGFGGPPGLATYLRTHQIDALIDATHPFAAQMTNNAATAAFQTNTPLLAIHRPAWKSIGAWQEVPTIQAAADAIGPVPRRVLLTIGQKDLAAFTAAAHHTYIVRSIDPPSAPPPNALVLTTRGPYVEADERALLQHHRIEILVTKNAGGTATIAKLAAAAALGIKIVVVARPPLPAALTTVPTAESALLWLDAQAETRRNE